MSIFKQVVLRILAELIAASEFLAIVYNIIDHQEAFLKGYFSIHENSGRDYSHLLPNFLMFTHGKVSFLVSLFFRASGLSGALQSLLTI